MKILTLSSIRWQRGSRVVVWVTEDFQSTDEWLAWATPAGNVIKAAFRIHAVLLVGYDEDYVYVNNPLLGVKDEQISKGSFIEAWEQLGKQAVTYKK